MPALLKSTSRRPNVSFVCAKSARTDAGSPTSVGTTSVAEPVALALLRRDVLQQLLAAAGQDDRDQPFLEQRERRGLADAAAGAGDDRDLVDGAIVESTFPECRARPG